MPCFPGANGVQLQNKDLWAELRKYDHDTYPSIDYDLLVKIRNWCLSVSL